MAECLVGLGHLVRVLTLLHCTATAFGSVHEFTGQAQIHRLLATLLGGFTQPAHGKGQAAHRAHRSEEHTSELQSRENLVCRLLLEKKKQNTTRETSASTHYKIQ